MIINKGSSMRYQNPNLHEDITYLVLQVSIEAMRTKLLCKIMSFLRNLLCNRTSRQTKLLIMINKEDSTKVVQFMAPESGVVASGVLVLGPDYSDYVVNMHYFFSRSFLYYLTSFGRTIGKNGDF